MKKLIAIFLLLTGVPVSDVFAQGPSFRASLEPDTVLWGNLVKVSFTVKNGDAQNFQAPSFVGFDLAAGPNTSSSFRIINGSTSREITYSYYLKPRDIGNVFIEPAYVEVDGVLLETPALEVVIEPNPDGIQQIAEPRLGPEFIPGRNREGLDTPDPTEAPAKKRKTTKL